MLLTTHFDTFHSRHLEAEVEVAEGSSFLKSEDKCYRSLVICEVLICELKQGNRLRRNGV